jgi:hypothetical protein
MTTSKAVKPLNREPLNRRRFNDSTIQRFNDSTLLTLFTLLTLLTVLGCSSVSYTRTEPGGEKVSFATQSLFTRKAIKDVEYTAGIGTNGLRRFNLKGYSNNQTEAIREAIAAALEAYSNRAPAPPANPPLNR